MRLAWDAWGSSSGQSLSCVRSCRDANPIPRNSFDMRLMKNNIALLYPDAIFLCSQSNEDLGITQSRGQAGVGVPQSWGVLSDSLFCHQLSRLLREATKSFRQDNTEGDFSEMGIRLAQEAVFSKGGGLARKAAWWQSLLLESLISSHAGQLPTEQCTSAVRM